MRRIHLESSTLASALYRPENRELEVEFRSGKIYRYRDVPRHIYLELLASPSKGRYYNSAIRNRFSFKQITHQTAHQTGVI
jgi:hypothetical protein